MNDTSYPPNTDQPDPNTNDDEAATPLSDVAEEPAHAEPQEEQEEKLAALNDQVLRLAAELENTRRRAEREKVEAGRYAISNFARDLLGVADNFDRALQAADDGAATSNAEIVDGLLAGIRMTEKELLSVLDRHGVKRISPEGEKFDPHLHQAVAQVPSANIPSGHIVDVAQTGFVIADRVLRAAIVTVSNGEVPATPTPSIDESA